MDYRLIIALVALLPMNLLANDAHPAPAAEAHPAKPAAEGIVDANATTAPRLEIRKYRFFHDAKLQRERLVLEFDRRDFYYESKPRVQSEALSAQEILVKLENAVLMGAIPESLINDSYTHQSKFMGPIAMDDRSMSTGLAMKMKLKDFDLGYKAEWLANPARLVIDVFTKTGKEAKHLARGGSKERSPRSLAVEHKDGITGFGDFLCFPAKAKVGLAVVFQPQPSQKRQDSMQKFRVNIDGSSIGLITPLDQESIVCYPKTAQVKAALSFQPTEAGGMGTPSGGGASSMFNFNFPPAGGGAEAHSAPAAGHGADAGHGTAAAAPVAPVSPTAGHSDAELDPGHAEERGTASTPSSPASLLPPIGH